MGVDGTVGGVESDSLATVSLKHVFLKAVKGQLINSYVYRLARGKQLGCPFPPRALSYNKKGDI